MVDGYNPVCEQNKLDRLGCWAHARRKFIERNGSSQKEKPAKQI